MTMEHPSLALVVCVSDQDTFEQCLLGSPGLQTPGGKPAAPLLCYEGCQSVAEGFDKAVAGTQADWLVVLHQDVWLPDGWCGLFAQRIAEAGQRFERLAVVGIYGLSLSTGQLAEQAGIVWDRDRWLQGSVPLPARASALDELCFAVRRDSGLRLDGSLGFHLYATDLVLQANERGLDSCIVAAPCHHHSQTPRADFSAELIQAFSQSAVRFEEKWRHCLPIRTPCIDFSCDVPVLDTIAHLSGLAAGGGDDDTVESKAKTPTTNSLDIFAAVSREFFSYSDFRYGWGMLNRRLPHSRWHLAYTDDLYAWLRDQAGGLAECTGEVILITDPHVAISRKCLKGLRQTLAAHPDDIAIPMAIGQPNLPFTLDYSTVRGMDRVIEREQRQPVMPYLATGNGSNVSMMRATTLKHLLTTCWSGESTVNTWVSPQAVAHCYTDYHGSDRAEVIPHLPLGVKRLLDIGGGCGNFAALAKRERLCEAHVFEKHPAAAESARQRVDHVWEGDFPGMLPAQIPLFDCVTALDVIEHMEDPDACLEAIATLLLPQGHLVASLPNLGHWSVVLDLLEGYWDYAPVGIASRSHLRFFTRSTICDLFEGQGWLIEAITPILVPMPESMHRPIAILGETLALQIDAESLDTYQYIIRARRP